MEHYEIARYGTLIAWARELGRDDCASVLEQTLAEEKAADLKLTEIAEARLNRLAAQPASTVAQESDVSVEAAGSVSAAAGCVPAPGLPFVLDRSRAGPAGCILGRAVSPCPRRRVRRLCLSFSPRAPEGPARPAPARAPRGPRPRRIHVRAVPAMRAIGIDVTVASGRRHERRRHHRSASWRPTATSLRDRLHAALAAVDSSSLAGDDARALGVMRGWRSAATSAPSRPRPTPAQPDRPDCRPPMLRRDRRRERSTRSAPRIYACYGWAQSHVGVGPTPSTG